MYVLQNVLGSQWTKISHCMPGRTDNSVKNRFHLLQRAVNRGAYDVSFMVDVSFVQGVVNTRMTGQDGKHSSSMQNLFFEQQQQQQSEKVLFDRPRRAIKRPVSYLEYVEPDEVLAPMAAPDIAAVAAVSDASNAKFTTVVSDLSCEQHHREEETKHVSNEVAFEMLCAQLHLPDFNLLDLGFEENSTFWLEEDEPSSDGGDDSPFPASSSSSTSIC